MSSSVKRESDGILSIYDTERGGASKVRFYICRDRTFEATQIHMDFAESKKHFSAEILKKQYISNLMSPSSLQVKDVAKIEELLGMRDTGLKKLEVLVSRICPGYIEGVWRDEDLATMKLRKQPARSGGWTRSGALASIAKSAVRADDTSAALIAKSPLEFDGVKTFTVSQKRWKARVEIPLSLMRIQMRTFRLRSYRRLRGSSPNCMRYHMFLPPCSCVQSYGFEL